jgi:hypothetical protein
MGKPGRQTALALPETLHWFVALRIRGRRDIATSRSTKGDIAGGAAELIRALTIPAPTKIAIKGSRGRRP